MVFPLSKAGLSKRSSPPPLLSAAFERIVLPSSLAGLPAISVPCGFSDGLPVGLQLVGQRLAEGTLIAAAAAYERATRWHDCWPPGLAPGGES